MVTSERPTFYFDVASPFSYLGSWRVEEVLGTAVDWRPIFLYGLRDLTGAAPPYPPDELEDREGALRRRASAHGLPFTWPEGWPNNPLAALRIACWALDTHGRAAGAAFVRALLESGWQQGRPLTDMTVLRDAAARAGLEPDEATAAASDQRWKDRLRETTAEAAARGVLGVPTTAVGDELFWGDDRLEDAAAAWRRACG